MKHTALQCALLSFFLLNAENFDQEFDRANQIFISGKFEDAILAYRALVPDHGTVPQVHFNLATAYFHANKRDEAVPHYLQAIELDPHYLKAYCQLGKVYEDKGDTQKAMSYYEKAAEIDPGCLAAVLPLARMHNDNENFEYSLELFYKAVKHHPRNPQLMLDLGNTLTMLNRDHEALAWFLRMVELLPENSCTLYSVAYMLKKLSMIEASLPYYKRVFVIDPNHYEARFGYGLAMLVTAHRNPDNWRTGWHYYESRWKRESGMHLRTYTQPVWDGSDPRGKVFFLWAEQGLGDSFEFIRYARVIKELGAARVIMAVPSPIETIVKLCPYIDEVIGMHETPSYFDVHVPLLSMPYLCKTPLDNVPNEVPYLYADPTLEAEWKRTLAHDRNFKIGICWQGNPNYQTLFLRKAVAAKSMSLEEFIPIMELPGVSVYSLQKMSGTDQINVVPDHLPFYVFEDDFDATSGRFMDTAAVIKNLDLVISIDTSICHFAAALGVPVWNLLPEPPDWRWMLDCDDTPWYPNMRLFRQPTSGDWKSVIDNVVHELKTHFTDQTPLIYFKNSYKNYMHNRCLKG